MQKQKILIIKVGFSETLDSQTGFRSSLGDVLRTTPILHLFKDANVTWLVDEKAYQLLEGNLYIHRIVFLNTKAISRLQNEKFDIVINFEKIRYICILADSIKTDVRYGFKYNKAKSAIEACEKAEDAYRIDRK